MDNNLDHSFGRKIFSTGRKLNWPVVLLNKDGKLNFKKMMNDDNNIFTFLVMLQGFLRSSLATTDP